eukprot:jgi/Chlat1/2162/Chrsp17S02737
MADATVAAPVGAVADRHSARVETEEQRQARKRREAEDRKRREEQQHRQQQQRASAASEAQHRSSQGGQAAQAQSQRPQQQPGQPPGEQKPAKPLPPEADGKETNLLRRPTRFQCRIGFRNDLPDVPAEPKFLTYQFNKDRYVQWRPTTLEKAHTHDILCEPDLGIPIDFMSYDPLWAPRDPNATLDPEDIALMEGLNAAPAAAAPKKHRPELAWLMRTKYISNDETVRQAAGATERRARMLRQQALVADEELEGLDDRQKQIHIINKTFEAAKEPPVHATNPSLTAVSVLPILPDTDRWRHHYVHASFDTAPTEDVEGYKHLTAEQRSQLETKAIIKSYAIQSDNQVEKFVALLMPQLDAQDEPSSSDNGDHYVWVREYNYMVKPEKSGERQTYCLRFDDDAVRYLDLNTKLVLNKKKAKDGGSKLTDLGDFKRPQLITLKRRGESQQEQQITQKKLRALEQGATGQLQEQMALSVVPAGNSDDEDVDISGSSDSE